MASGDYKFVAVRKKGLLTHFCVLWDFEALYSYLAWHVTVEYINKAWPMLNQLLTYSIAF